MPLRQLVEADCGGANPLMQLGGQFTRDMAYKDEGFSNIPFESRAGLHDNQLVNEFLGQISAPPQTFQMNDLLQEMREIESRNFHPQVLNAPRVADEVAMSSAWAKEFSRPSALGAAGAGFENLHIAGQSNNLNKIWNNSQMIDVQPVREEIVYANEFFDVNEGALMPNYQPNLAMNTFMPPQYISNEVNNQDFVERSENITENWLDEFQKSKDEEAKKTENYNEQFWQKLQDEWQKMAEESDKEHPWLSEFSDLYDPYKEYNFREENAMEGMENALQKGKEFLEKGDIPSAVLCFEVAAKQDSQNAEAWELLGISQAENEMDPYAIAALKKSLDLNPSNMKVLMALAVSYTNESLQSQALRMLLNWLYCHPTYKHLVDPNLIQSSDSALTSSLIRGPELKEIQSIFLEAVKQNPNQVDADIQEALGVLFNLSSEYDKAVDCFQAALNVRPTNAKAWNRLGASLANGNRSVEAVEAYQRALELEPGFIRVRYNVGICCMNLKAYKQAAEHLLTALNSQASSGDRSGLEEAAAAAVSGSAQMSDTIWSTLKMVVSLMGRSDLHGFINNRNLNALNEAFTDS